MGGGVAGRIVGWLAGWLACWSSPSPSDSLLEAGCLMLSVPMGGLLIACLPCLPCNTHTAYSVHGPRLCGCVIRVNASPVRSCGLAARLQRVRKTGCKPRAQTARSALFSSTRARPTQPL